MSNPNLKEVEWAISELENEESSFSVYAKLADLYTVRNEMLKQMGPQTQIAAHSEKMSPLAEPLECFGDSDFLQTVSGKDPLSAWTVMDELMDTLRVVNYQVYNSVMRKLARI